MINPNWPIPKSVLFGQIAAQLIVETVQGMGISLYPENDIGTEDSRTTTVAIKSLKRPEEVCQLSTR